MSLESSFYGDEIADLNSIIAEFPEGDENPEKLPVKKLLDAFENIAKSEQHLKVYIRIRPVGDNAESTVKVLSPTAIMTCAPYSSSRAKFTKTEERHYAFNRVFGPASSQVDVFDEAVQPLFDRFINGDSCVLFAYGMTNAGKTHTIQGTTLNPGILPRLVDKILEHLRKSDATAGKQILQISMLEIYQEKIFDLLNKNNRDKLQIRDANGRVEVSKLSSYQVTNSIEANKLLDKATSARSKASTLLNAGSSRSHAVYVLTLGGKNSDGDEINSHVFQIVDLAGAERMSRTKATASQQREANNINMSLMQLWRCLQGMRRKSGQDGSATGGGGGDIIPFRESKLTHLLMPLLSQAGLSGVAMITCVNPQPDDYDETISILGNASLACKIREIADIGRNHPVNAAAVGTLTRLNSSESTSGGQRPSSQLSSGAAVPAVGLGANRKRKIDPSASNSTSAPNLSAGRMGGSNVAGANAHNPHLPNGKKHVCLHAVKPAGPGHHPSGSNYSSSHALPARNGYVGITWGVGGEDGGEVAGVGGHETDTVVGDRGEADPDSEGAALYGDGDGEVFDHDMTRVDEGEEGGEEEPLAKRLRLEVGALRERNEWLERELLCKEGAVRLEVSKEMSVYSAGLLSEIQSLRDQLSSSSSGTAMTRRDSPVDTSVDGNTSHPSMEGAGRLEPGLPLLCTKDLTRSCQKARRKHLERMREELIDDLREAEEEMKRLKMQHESELEKLSAENAYLKSELSEWKSKAEAALKKLSVLPRVTGSCSTSPNRSGGSAVVLANHYPNNSGLASGGCGAQQNTDIQNYTPLFALNAPVAKSNQKDVNNKSSSASSQNGNIINEDVSSNDINNENHHSSKTIMGLRSNTSAVLNTISSNLNNENASKNAEYYFNQRMGRDPRFNKQSNASLTANTGKCKGVKSKATLSSVVEGEEEIGVGGVVEVSDESDSDSDPGSVFREDSFRFLSQNTTTQALGKNTDSIHHKGTLSSGKRGRSGTTVTAVVPGGRPTALSGGKRAALRGIQ